MTSTEQVIYEPIIYNLDIYHKFYDVKLWVNPETAGELKLLTNLKFISLSESQKVVHLLKIVC